MTIIAETRVSANIRSKQRNPEYDSIEIFWAKKRKKERK